jgi:hypothetical protein
VSESRALERLLGTVERYVVMTPAQRLAVALWIVHTHCRDANGLVFEQTPYLTVTSPQRQCGKSRLLELLELLVPEPWMTITPSEAVVYRYIDSTKPTLLLDEVDAIFSPKTADRYESLRAILNAGHRRGATVPRCIGTALEPQNFNVFCPKVLAGIGTLPDTITDRSIPIRLQRKTRSEPVERFRRRDVEAVTTPLREALAAWGWANAAALADARPDLPDELSDRMQEGCEPLLAIADALDYREEARAALVELLTSERADETEAASIRLLRSIRTVFLGRDSHVISTVDLISALAADGWDNWCGRLIGAQDIAALLKPYGIKSKTVRLSSEQVAKGYKRDDFAEAWSRYLPVTESPDESGVVTTVTAVTPTTEDEESYAIRH